MYQLPDLQPWCAGRCWLSPAGSAEFITIAANGGDASDWRRLLGWEPGLALWAAAGLQWRLEEPPRMSELAGWLHRCAVGKLAPWHDQQQPAPPSEEDRAKLARDTADALALTRALEQRAEAGPSARLEQALVRGMLRGMADAPAAPAWLQACRGSTKLSQDLPAEASRLVEFELTSDASPAAQGSPDAADAGRSQKSATAAPPAPLDLDGAKLLRQARRDAGQRWLAVLRPLPLGAVTAAIARNTKLEQRFAAQLQDEKLESLKELAYGASHEINNPLANITMRAQALMRDEQDPERRHKLEAIVTEGYRAHEMISDMMLFAKPPTLQCETVDLVELSEQTIAEAKDSPEAGEAKWSFVAVEESASVHADRQHLGATLRAVFRNALEATDGRGQIRVQLTGDAGCVRVEVEDDGPGLTARERRHLFDPFFSGREAGRGLGLGLSKAWTVVREHGGDIAALDGNPTRIVIRLPRAR